MVFTQRKGVLGWCPPDIYSGLPSFLFLLYSFNLIARSNGQTRSHFLVLPLLAPEQNFDMNLEGVTLWL